MTAFTEQPEFVECAIVHRCLLGHINTIITLLMSFVSLWFYPLPLNTIKVERSEHGQNGTSTECSQKNSWIVGDEDEMQQMLQASNRVNESSSLAASGNLFSSNRLKVLHVLHHKM